MLCVFIDSSVLFSAAYSSKGHACDLIIMAARNEFRLVISPLVMDKTRRNLADFAPEVLPALEQIFDAIDFEIINPSKADVIEAAKIVALNTAAILAAVNVAQVDMFVTLDKKHLVNRPKLEAYARTLILRSVDAYQRITGLIKNSKSP
jgi:predicted nucleic acid-binding protein